MSRTTFRTTFRNFLKYSLYRYRQNWRAVLIQLSYLSIIFFSFTLDAVKVPESRDLDEERGSLHKGSTLLVLPRSASQSSNQSNSALGGSLPVETRSRRRSVDQAMLDAVRDASQSSTIGKRLYSGSQPLPPPTVTVSSSNDTENTDPSLSGKRVHTVSSAVQTQSLSLLTPSSVLSLPPSQIDITRTLSVTDVDVLQRVPQELSEQDIYGLDGMLYGYLKQLMSIFASANGAHPTCFICYAWPNNKAECEALQKRIRLIRDLLRAANINASMDIVDNISGAIDPYRRSIFSQDFVLFMGSEAVFQKYEEAHPSEAHSSQETALESDAKRNNVVKEISAIRERMKVEGVDFIIPIILDQEGHRAIQKALGIDAVHDDWREPFSLLNGVLHLASNIYQRFLSQISPSKGTNLKHCLEHFNMTSKYFVQLIQPSNLQNFREMHIFEEYQLIYQKVKTLRGLYETYEQNTAVAHMQLPAVDEIDAMSQEPFERLSLERFVAKLREETSVYRNARLHHRIGTELSCILFEYRKEKIQDDRLGCMLATFADEAYCNALYGYEKCTAKERLRDYISRCLMERGQLRGAGFIMPVDEGDETAEFFYQRALMVNPANAVVCGALAQLLDCRLGSYTPEKLYRQAYQLIKQKSEETRTREEWQIYKDAQAFLGIPVSFKQEPSQPE